MEFCELSREAELACMHLPVLIKYAYESTHEVTEICNGHLNARPHNWAFLDLMLFHLLKEPLLPVKYPLGVPLEISPSKTHDQWCHRASFLHSVI